MRSTARYSAAVLTMAGVLRFPGEVPTQLAADVVDMMVMTGQAPSWKVWSGQARADKQAEALAKFL